MNQLITLITAHPLYWSAVLLFLHHVFDAAVDSLKPPSASSSAGYEFLYNFANKLAGNYRQKS